MSSAMPGSSPRRVLFAAVLLAAAVPGAAHADVDADVEAGRAAVRHAHKAYVLNTGSASVTVINTRTGKARKTIKVAGEPRSVVVTPNGKTAYVLVWGQKGVVTPIDTRTDKPGRPIKVGAWPVGRLVVTPDSRKVYVMSGGNKIIPITTKTNKAGKPIKEGPAGSRATDMALTHNGKTLYVLNVGTNSVAPIDVATGRAGRALTGIAWVPVSIAVTKDDQRAFVSESCCGLVPIDLKTFTAGTPLRVPDPSKPLVFVGRTALSPDQAASVTPFDTVTGTLRPAVKVADQPSRIAVAPNGKVAYVIANGLSVTPIKIATLAAGRPTRLDAWYGAFTADGKTLYVTNTNKNTVTPIKVSTNRRGKAIKVGRQPVQIVTTP
jgi:hyaluronoglucosaminidase